MGEEVQRATAAVDAFPEEFRITELGLLPRQWHVVPFMKAVVDPTVKVNKVQKRHYQTTGRFPIIDQGKSTIAGYWDDQTDVYQGPLPVIVFGDHTRIFKFVETPFVCGADGVKLLSPNTSKFDPAFLFFTLLNLDIPDRGYNRHFRLLREQQLPLPPLGEQRAIASALRAVQQAKEATEQVIEATRELKKSLMRYLFMYGLVPISEADRVLLKETEIGLIPENWTVCRLGEVCGVRYGLGQPPEMADDGVPMLRATNIKRGRIDENQLLKVNRDAIPQSRSPYLKYGDILVVRSGAYTGDVAMITKKWEGCIAGYDLVVSPGKAVDAKCCSYYLLSEQAQRYFRSQRDRSAQPHINRGQLEQTLIPVPPRSEQHAIAGVLDVVDKKLQAEEDRGRALDELFKSLLHNLMEGKIRLPEFAGGE